MIVALNTGQIRSALGVFVLGADDRVIWPLNCSDESTAITVGTRITLPMPFGISLTSIRAYLVTAQTSGSTFTIDIRKSGVSIFSTLLTIDNSEQTNQNAAVPYVLSTTTLEDRAEISIIITQAGTSPIGLKIYFYGTEI